MGRGRCIDDRSHHLLLGRLSPLWIPDEDAVECMMCRVQFRFYRRRHHCRACGKVLCHRCSSVRFPLMFLDGAEARVCWPCKTVMIQIDLGYMDKTLEESFKFMQELFQHHEEANHLTRSNSIHSTSSVPQDEAQSDQNMNCSAEEITTVESNRNTSTMSTFGFLSGLWKLVTWHTDNDSILEEDEIHQDFSDILNHSDSENILEWLFQIEGPLDEKLQEDQVSVVSEDDSFQVRHVSVVNIVSEESDSETEEADSQLTSGFEHYLHNIKHSHNRANSTSTANEEEVSEESSNHHDEEMIKQISEDEMSLHITGLDWTGLTDLDASVQSPLLPSSDAKVAEASTPVEASWLRASCRKVAGDSDNSEDDIISEERLQANQPSPKMSSGNKGFRGSFMSLSSHSGLGSKNNSLNRKLSSSTMRLVPVKMRRQVSLIGLSNVSLRSVKEIRRDQMRRNHEENDLWQPAQGW